LPLSALFSPFSSSLLTGFSSVGPPFRSAFFRCNSARHFSPCGSSQFKQAPLAAEAARQASSLLPASFSSGRTGSFIVLVTLLSAQPFNLPLTRLAWALSFPLTGGLFPDSEHRLYHWMKLFPVVFPFRRSVLVGDH